jgi:hypothetical protein
VAEKYQNCSQQQSSSLGTEQHNPRFYERSSDYRIEGNQESTVIRLQPTTGDNQNGLIGGRGDSGGSGNKMGGYQKDKLSYFVTHTNTPCKNIRDFDNMSH